MKKRMRSNFHFKSAAEERAFLKKAFAREAALGPARLGKRARKKLARAKLARKKAFRARKPSAAVYDKGWASRYGRKLSRAEKRALWAETGGMVHKRGTAKKSSRKSTRKGKSYCSICRGPHRYKHGRK